VTVPNRFNDIEALGQLLQVTLQSVVGTFESARIDVPVRRYIAYGSVVADCEQLTVQLAQLYPGLPGADPSQVARCNGPRTAVLIVQLFRCAPVASGPRGQGAPTSEAISESTLRTVRDVWLMLDSAGAIDAAGWNTGVIAEVSPIDMSGGYIGVSMTLTLTVP